MKQKKESKKGIIIINPSHKNDLDNNPQLLRVTLTNKETKLDFGYQTESYYKKGGWVRMDPKTFIRPIGSNKKYTLINATNIPLEPEQLNFKSQEDSLYFSLIFPALPEGVDAIDMIETPDGEKPKEGFVSPNSVQHDYNFFHIKLNEKGKIYKIK